MCKNEMSYFVPFNQTTDKNENFLHMMYALKPTWTESLETYLGINHDITISNFAFGYNSNVEIGMQCKRE